MWKKRLSDQRLMYFRFAPPFTELDTYTAKQRIEPPYPDAPPEHCSVYYFWWAYLRENEEYIQCCDQGGNNRFEKLYADFGDIRDNDFFDWWIRIGRELFRERDIDPITRIHSASDWNSYDGSMLIRIPPSRDLKRLTAEFEKFLKDELEGKEHDDWSGRPRYEISGSPNIQALYTQLRVYQLKKRHPDWTLDKIGAFMELDERGKQPNESDFVHTPEPMESVRAAIRSDISRKLGRAKILIQNVAEGIFPLNHRI